MFKNLKVGTKLLVLILIGAISSLLIGVAGFLAMTKLGNAVEAIGKVRMPSIMYLEEVAKSQNFIAICERGGYVNRRVTADVRKVLYEKVEATLKDAEEAIKKYEPLPQTVKEEKLWKEFLPLWSDWKKGMQQSLAISQERDRLIFAGKSPSDPEVVAIDQKLYTMAMVHNREIFLKTNEKLEAIIDENVREGNANVSSAEASLSNGLITIVAFFVAGVILLMIFGYIIARNITRPLLQAVEVAQAVSQGDFSKKLELDSADEIGEMAAALNRIPATLGQINEQFVHLAKAADAGELSFRGDADKFAGAYREIISIVNKTLDNISEPINRAMKALDRMQVNDLTVTVDADGLKGDYLKIATSVNNVHDRLNRILRTVEGVAVGDLSILPEYEKVGKRSEQDRLMPGFIKMMHAINLLIKDANMLAQAGLEGRLDARADASAHAGAYKEIVVGVNNFIEAVATPTGEVINVMNEMAKGDLTVRVNGNYQGMFAELKDNINSSLASLESTIGQVTEAVQQVNSGSQQIADASQSLSQGATEQAASLEEISSSMNEIGSQITHNAENAGQASKVSNEARSAAETGSQNMDKMVDAMRDISVSSQQIAKVNKVIDDIAFQTNLLALNAAVEAARAGVHGKGFAVVADEVRNLAGRSAKAAKETAEMIDSSLKKVENGLNVAEETATAFTQIVGGIVKVADLASEIAVASNEQAQGISQINQGLNQIDQVTQQNTAHAEETAAAAEELSGQANHLLNLAGQFTISGGASVSSFTTSAITRPTPKPMVKSAKALPGKTKTALKAAPENKPEGDWGKNKSGKDLISFEEDGFGRF